MRNSYRRFRLKSETISEYIYGYVDSSTTQTLSGQSRGENLRRTERKKIIREKTIKFKEKNRRNKSHNDGNEIEKL